MKIRPKPRGPSKGADEGWAALSTLISGFVIFGGIGWLLDAWWGTRLMTPIGLLAGMSLGIYAVVLQFGRPETADRTQADAQKADAGVALRAAKAVNRANAVNRARAGQTQAVQTQAVQTQVAPTRAVHSPTDGPPPASTRRETECH